MKALPLARLVLLLHLTASAAAAQSVYDTGTTIWDASKAWAGYTLFVQQGSGKAVLIDMPGDVVHTWSSPFAEQELALVEPLGNGHILGVTRPIGVPAVTAVELDWNGNLVWSYTLPPGTGILHHDVQRLPNGNTLLLCSQTITVPSISNLPLIDDYLLIVDPAGNIVWSWFTWEHFGEFGFSSEQEELIAASAGDWAHANAADVFPANTHTDPAFREGNVIVSQRFTNIVFVIQRLTGQVAWQSGPDDNLTWGQHNTHMIEQGLDGAGNFLVFNNGSGTGYLPVSRAPGFSAVHEIDPVEKTFAWTYNAASSGLFNRLFWSDIVSNAQRLPNGNTFICSGVKGRLFEVTHDGEIVWEYMSPYIGIAPVFGVKTPLIYRAHRVPLTWTQVPFFRRSTELPHATIRDR